MPQVGFEPTIPAFERAKTIHSLDRAATVTGTLIISSRLKMKLSMETVSREKKLLWDQEGNGMFIRNVVKHLPGYLASHPTRKQLPVITVRTSNLTYI
jgi:hypothetical protein